MIFLAASPARSPWDLRFKLGPSPLTPSSHICPAPLSVPSPGKHVKQADVVLLGYPMMYPMSSEVRRNDLEMYEAVTELDGPAMTWVSSQAEWKPNGFSVKGGSLLQGSAPRSAPRRHLFGSLSCRACLRLAGWS